MPGGRFGRTNPSRSKSSSRTMAPRTAPQKYCADFTRATSDKRRRARKDELKKAASRTAAREEAAHHAGGEVAGNPNSMAGDAGSAPRAAQGRRRDRFGILTHDEPPRGGAALDRGPV